jgi:Tol biopolymer transport system component
VSLSPSDTIGPYKIVSLLGSGGMGVVYRALDTRLGRDVALKILPASFAADPDRVMRFEREARTLASINHPHIAGIYGVEETTSVDGSRTRALVMELVEGEDLSDRIARGAIPLLEALAIARQIAEALETAHELGVIHRDLKPANIKIKEDASVKVLDFGLAKGVGAESTPPPDAALSPTITSPAMTQMGLIIGTAAYMAPEQAKGRAVDRRADVWAFGVVLYEMLTGERLFAREDVTETLAAVLTAEPDWSQLPSSTPPRIRQLLSRCLAKDRKQRLDSMSAIRFEIDDARLTPVAEVPARRRYVAIGGIALAFVLGWIGSMFLSRQPQARPAAIISAELPPPPDALSAFHNGFALSPDGETLVFASRAANGVKQLWTRRVDSTLARALPGTENGAYPFWSPLGTDIAFFSDNKLRRIPSGGGAVQTICDVVGFFTTGSWSINNEILFGVINSKARIWKVPASGGTATIVEHVGNALAPRWLADGKRFLYAANPGASDAIHLVAVAGGVSKLIARSSDFWLFSYAVDSNLLLMNRNDVLTAQRLDVDAESLVGPIIPVGARAGSPNAWLAVSMANNRLVAMVSRASDDGAAAGNPSARLEWVTRQGARVGSVGTRARYFSFALSDDGLRVAANPNDDIWLLDANGRSTRLTTTAGTEWAAIWSPDGSTIVFRTEQAVARKHLDRDEAPSELKNVMGQPVDWSTDGRWITFDHTSGDRPVDIWIYDAQNGEFQSWLSTDFAESAARVSPDGRWVAYVSDSSGRREVYLRSFDRTGNPVSVSLSGGRYPQFQRDGRELYFIAPDDTMMAVDLVRNGSSITPGEPRKLFSVPLNDIANAINDSAPFAVAPDGQRFLLNVPDRPDSLFFLQGVDALIGRTK